MKQDSDLEAIETFTPSLPDDALLLRHHAEQRAWAAKRCCTKADQAEVNRLAIEFVSRNELRIRVK